MRVKDEEIKFDTFYEKQENTILNCVCSYWFMRIN